MPEATTENPELTCEGCGTRGLQDTMALIGMPGRDEMSPVCSPQCAGKVMSAGELAHLGVSCDQPPYCDVTLSGDFKVRVADTRETRLGYVLDAAASAGWRVEGRENPLSAKTFCPSHVGP